MPIFPVLLGNNQQLADVCVVHHIGQLWNCPFYSPRRVRPRSRRFSGLRDDPPFVIPRGSLARVGFSSFGYQGSPANSSPVSASLT